MSTSNTSAHAAIAFRDAIFNHPGLSWRAKLLGYTLAQHMGTDGRARPGWRRLAKHAGVSESTAMRGTRELKGAGLVEITQFGNGRALRYRSLVSRNPLENPSTTVPQTAVGGEGGEETPVPQTPTPVPQTGETPVPQTGELERSLGLEALNKADLSPYSPPEGGKKNGRLKELSDEELELYESLVEAVGITPSLKRTRRSYEAFARELHELGWFSEEVFRRAAAYRDKYTMDITLKALASNWDALEDDAGWYDAAGDFVSMERGGGPREMPS
jgi:hypothetical protein